MMAPLGDEMYAKRPTRDINEAEKHNVYGFVAPISRFNESYVISHFLAENLICLKRVTENI